MEVKGVLGAKFLDIWTCMVGVIGHQSINHPGLCENTSNSIS